MCDYYYHRRANRWRLLEELEDEELDALLQGEVTLATTPAVPKRRPTALLR